MEIQVNDIEFDKLIKRFGFYVNTIGSLEELRAYKIKNQATLNKRYLIENELFIKNTGAFILEGWNPIIDQATTFQVKKNRGQKRGELKVPNIRESFLCSKTNLNNRLRATGVVLEWLLKNRQKKELDAYFTEQLTPFYKLYKKRANFKSLVGSEYLGDDLASGYTNANGILHQDLTQLSFDDNSFDLNVCLEVLEHVPNYKAAISEIYRTLKKDGIAVITAPFTNNKMENTIRATIDDNGNINHILPPEYHGDPVKSADGILCFHYFGWEFINELRQLGFREVNIAMCWSEDFGIYGGNSYTIYCIK